MSGVHVLFSQVQGWRLERQFCPICNKRRYFWCWWQAWYGWESTCLRCGDAWHDGEIAERPFMRGWRKKSIDAAMRHARRTFAAGIPSEPNLDDVFPTSTKESEK